MSFSIRCIKEVDKVRGTEQYIIEWHTDDREYRCAFRDTEEEAINAYRYIESVQGNTVERTELDMSTLLGSH
tara:strand:- start:685 stop:900 length:216 start_codon:yes stop_codon:yes gene_type:complete